MPVFKVKSNHKSAIDNIVFYMQIDSAQMEELSKLTESMPVYCIGISSAEGEDVKEVKSYSEGINIIKSLTLHRKTWLKVGLDCTIIGIREEIYETIKLSFDNSMKKVIVALPTEYSTEDKNLVNFEHKLIGELLDNIGNHLTYTGSRNKFALNNYTIETDELKNSFRFGTDGKYITMTQETYVPDITQISKVATI